MKNTAAVVIGSVLVAVSLSLQLDGVVGGSEIPIRLNANVGFDAPPANEYEYNVLVGSMDMFELYNVQKYAHVENMTNDQALMVGEDLIGILQNAWEGVDAKLNCTLLSATEEKVSCSCTAVGNNAPAHAPERDRESASSDRVTLDYWFDERYGALEIYSSRGHKGEKESRDELINFIAKKMKAEIFQGTKLPRGIRSDRKFSYKPSDIGTSRLEVNQVWNEISTGEHDIVESILEDLFNKHETDHLFMTDGFQVVEGVANMVVADSVNPDIPDRCISIDDTIWTCKSFTQSFAEVFTHVPASYLYASPVHVLVMGGDFNVIKEVLKYKTVENLVVILDSEAMLDTLAQDFDDEGLYEGSLRDDERIIWKFGKYYSFADDLLQLEYDFDLILLNEVTTNSDSPALYEELFTLVSSTGVFIHTTTKKTTVPLMPKGATHYHEFMQLALPLPVVGEREFVLGSDGCSLMFPRWKSFLDSEIETTFIGKDSTSRLRQVRSLVKKYQKRGLDFIDATFTAEDHIIEKENKNKREQVEQVCVDPDNLEPCYEETKGQPSMLPQSQWFKGACSVPHQSNKLKIYIGNNAPVPVHVFWLDRAASSLEKITTILPGKSQGLNTYVGHQFTIQSSNLNSPVSKAFDVTTQHHSHPRIVVNAVNGPDGDAAFGFVATRAPQRVI